jgi:hypothetical protein
MGKAKHAHHGLIKQKPERRFLERSGFFVSA